MKIALGVPSYFPSIREFYKIANCDIFVFQDTENLRNENKTALKTSQGRIVLSVPIFPTKNPIKDVKIVQNGWSKRHSSCIQMAYQGCKFHEHRDDIRKFLINTKWDNLTTLNIKLTKKLANIFGYDLVKFSRASETDLDDLLRDNILVTGEDFSEKPYPQLHGEYLPGASILDFLFNCGGIGKYNIRRWFNEVS